MPDTLAEIRRKIDALDARLVKLISARARIAQQVGKIKNGALVYRPEREAQVLRRVAELNKGPMPAAGLRRIYIEIMSACRALEAMMAVAYLGPQGTYSQEAAIRHFGGSIEMRSCNTIDDVFKQVETGAAGYGVAPVENSTEGAIGRTLDLLLTTPATAVELLAEKKAAGGGGRSLGAHPEDNRSVAVHSGRYGPYVKYGKVNATIPASIDPEKITLEEALELLSAKAAKSGKPVKAGKTGKTAKPTKTTKPNETVTLAKATKTKPKKKPAAKGGKRKAA